MLRHQEHQEAEVPADPLLPQLLRASDVRDARRRLLGQPRPSQRRRRVREGDGEHQQHRQARAGDDPAVQRGLAEEH